MKKLLSVLTTVLLSLLISSCACDIECTDCQDLDEENCNCIVDLACQCSDGIQNGKEIAIDMGSDCVDFFDCLTDDCSNLSGAISSGQGTSKTWVLVEPNTGAFVGWKEEFHSNGEYMIVYGGETGYGYWKFNNPGSTPAIIVSLDPARSPGDWFTNIGNTVGYPLLKLSADTLSRRHFSSGVTLIAVPE